MGHRLSPLYVTSGAQGRVVDPKYVWMMDKLPVWGTRGHVIAPQTVGNRQIFRVWWMGPEGVMMVSLLWRVGVEIS